MALTSVAIVQAILGQADSMLAEMVRAGRCLLVEQRYLWLHLAEVSRVLCRTHTGVASLPPHTLPTMLAQVTIYLAGLSRHRAVGSLIPGLAGAVEPPAALILHTGATRLTKARGSFTQRDYLLAVCSSVSFCTLALIVIMTKATTLIPTLCFSIPTCPHKLPHACTCAPHSHQCSPHTAVPPSQAHSHTYNTQHQT